MSRRAVLGMFVLVVAGLSGCATPAHVVDSDRTKVVVAVPDNTNTWPFYYRDEATRAASEMIQDPVLISSSRVKVGEQTTNVQDMTRRDIGDKDKPRFGEVVSSTNTTSTADRYEYHLEFQSRAPSQFVPQNRAGIPSPPVPGGAPVTPAGGIAPEGRMPVPHNPPPVGHTPQTDLPATRITAPPR